MMRLTAIALLSAGLDSTVATALAMRDHDVKLAITFDYGHRAARKEIEYAEKHCRTWGIEHLVIELPWFASETHSALVDRTHALPRVFDCDIEGRAESAAKEVWVPNRNAVFIAIAAAIAEARRIDAIVAGFNAEEARTFPDNSKEFLEAQNRLLKISAMANIRVISPTIAMKKGEIAEKFAMLNIPPDSFWCCYDGGEMLCGTCESCARTIRAFKAAHTWKLIENRFITTPFVR